MSNDTSDDKTVALPIPSGNDLVGQRFGHYQVLSELGRGGMATVYKADEESLNRVVALKIMSPKISQDPTMVKRFQREAQAAAQLNHPGIVHIYAIGEERGIHYFTMEYVKGQSLAQLKHARHRIPHAEAANYILQTAEALAEAHRHGMVHRDIKPANIMLDQAGRVRVTDFGIARVASANTQLTVDGSFLGTPQYMSPEQCEGKELDGRSDLYSLGLTFYELVSGRKPFDADTPGSIIVKIVNGDMISIRTTAPDLPGPICDVIDKMLHRDPAQRYQTAEELVADLRPLATAAAATTTEAPTRAFVAPVKTRPPAALKPPPMPVTPSKPAANSESHVLFVIAAIIAVVLLVAAGAAYGIYTLWQRSIESNKQSAAMAEAVSATEAAVAAAESAAVSAQQDAVDTMAQTEETLSSAADSLASDDVPVESVEPLAPIAATLSAAAEPGVDAEPTTIVEPAASQPEMSEALPESVEAEVPPTTEAPASAPAVAQIAMVQPALTQSRPAAAAGSLTITVTGDNSRAGLLVAAAQSALRGSEYSVVEPMTAAEVSSVAEFLLVIDVSPLGSRALQYLGRVTEQRSDSLTVKLIHTADGKVTGGPVNRTVEYTVFNADTKLRDAMAALLDDLRYPDQP